MRKYSLGAVSISALMLALAACGNDDNAYQTSEADAVDVEEDADRTAATEDDDLYADATDAQEGNSWDEENYSDIEDRSPNDQLTTATRTAEAPDAAATTKTRAEIESLALRAFASADADGDGSIDQEEYVQLALASARDFDAFVTEPVKLMSVNPATDPEATDTAATDDAMPDETDMSAPVQTAETAPALDDAETATIQTAAAETFEEVAGDDGEMTPEELRTAFLSRFDEADEDGDEELDAAELQTFAALTRGQDEND